MKGLYAYGLLVLALIVTAARPALSQDLSPSFVEKVAVTDEAVTFHTEGRYDGFVMTVAGPDDFYLKQSLAGDEALRLPLKTDTGLLADGSYRIEVTAHPYFSKETRAALDKVRGDKAAMHRIMKEAGIGERDMVYSMSVGIAEGKFIDPFEGEATDKPNDDEGTGKTLDMGALDDAPAGLDGQPAPRLIAPPDVTATGPQYAFQTAGNPALPQFISSEVGPDSPWVEAYFKNTGPDGTATVFQGYMRPVESENVAPLFLGYFRPMSANGAIQGTWHRGYFEFTGDGFSLVAQPGAATAGQQPFDYLTEDDPAQTEALRRDIVHLDDVIIQFSLCVGNDCVNGESFGFDTIRLKENNIRIHFQDTSTSASFPTNDWRIIANDSSNGGADYWAVEDSDTGRQIFRIEDDAPASSLYVEDGGRIGFGTSTPVVDLHVKSGNTPTLRLEQDGSNGFSAQTWDLAGNEANLFIRDATNGSRLPFRIFPNAPTDALAIEGTTGDVGVGTNSPSSSLQVLRSNGTAQIRVDETSGTVANRNLLIVDNNGPAGMRFDNANTGDNWRFGHETTAGVDFTITEAGAGTAFRLTNNGNLTLEGNCSDAAGGGGCTPDYVFEAGYEMLTLSELAAFIAQNKRLPNVPSAAEVQANGFNVQGMANATLEKVEELVLYTLQQQQIIEDLQARLKALEEKQQ